MPLEQVGLKYVLEGAKQALSQLQKISTAERDVGDNAKYAAGQTTGVGKAAVAAALGFASAEIGLKALKGAFQFGIGNAVQFEHAIDQVGAVSGATDSELGQLAGTAKQLGADTAFSAKEAAMAMHELAAGGRSVAQILGGEATAAVNLAAAGNYGLAESARTIATTMAVWEGTTIDTVDVVNRLAGAANTSRFGVEDMSMAIAQGGGVAAAAGVSFQDFSTAIAATASSFASGSDAGTSFKTFITSLSGSSEKAKDMIKELGLEFYTAQGTLKPMSAIVEELHTKLSNLSPELQTVALKTIFGNDAFRTAASLMKLSGDEFATMSNKMRDTSAADVAAQRMGNLAGKFEEFKGSAETLGITLGTKAIPLLTTLAEVGTNLLNLFGNLPASTQTILLLGTTAAIAAPKVVALATAVATLDVATLGAVAPVAAIVAGLVALDAITAKFTGDGLLVRLMGKAGDRERSEAALKLWEQALLNAGPNADKAAVAMNTLTAEVGRFVESGKSLDSTVGVFEVALKPWDAGDMKARADSAKDLIEKVKLLGAQMVANGADAFMLKEAYDSLPPSLQKVFSETTNVTALYASSQDQVERQIFGIRSLNEEHKIQASVLPEATTALGLFNESIAAEEEATGKAIDRTKELTKVLDILAGRFADLNPEIIAAEGQLAAVDEELADLKRSGKDYSDVLGMTKTELEAVKKGLEDQIEAAGENEKAVKGMREELQLYVGDGLLNLDSALRDSNLSLEDQVTVQAKVAEALRALSRDDIPGFIRALESIETKMPGISATVVSNLGPELTTKLKANIPELEATGSSLADAIADGIKRGLDSAQNRISGAARGLVEGAMDEMFKAAKSQSPSKVTEALGIFMAEGLALGFEKGTPLVIASAEQMARVGVETAKNVLNAAIASGELTPYLGADGGWHLPGSGAPGFAPLPPAVNSHIPTYIGGGTEVGMPHTPKVGDSFGTGTAKMTWNGTNWVQGGLENAYLTPDYILDTKYSLAPSVAVVASSPGGAGGSASQQINFDFSGANLTGTVGENEVMMRNVVTDALRDVSGRDAFLSGVA